MSHESAMVREIEVKSLRDSGLCAGDAVLLSGTLYTARDAAHKRLAQLLDAGEPLPFILQDAVIYYMGPSPAPPEKVIGSAGPTTSGRMDSYTPRLYSLGVCATVGKGGRSAAVEAAIKEHKGLYLCAVGGAGALLSQCITARREIAFPELGCEAITQIEVNKMPLIVAVDSFGGNLFKENNS